MSGRESTKSLIFYIKLNLFLIKKLQKGIHLPFDNQDLSEGLSLFETYDSYKDLTSG